MDARMAAQCTGAGFQNFFEHEEISKGENFHSAYTE